MTQETQTPKAAAAPRGDDLTLALDAGELTTAELVQVVGGGVVIKPPTIPCSDCA